MNLVQNELSGFSKLNDTFWVGLDDYVWPLLAFKPASVETMRAGETTMQ